MILSDEDLRYYLEKKKLIINSIHKKTIRENGVDLIIDYTIGKEKQSESFLSTCVIDSHNKEIVDNIFEKQLFIQDSFNKEQKYFILEPKTLYLLSTQEYIKLPDDLMGFCCLRSTVARYGFIAPITIVDAGFEGTLTIEVFYSGNRQFKLYVGDRFLHLVFARLNTPVRNLYNGIYKCQKGVKFPKCMD